MLPDIEEDRSRRFRPYPAYRDSGVAWLREIPVHWEAKALKRPFCVVNGSTPKSGESANWDGDIPWVTPDDLGKMNDRVLNEPARYLTRKGYESCGTQMVRAGSLVLSTRAPIGHLALAGSSVCTNQGCRSLVFRHSGDETYFYFQLHAAKPVLQAAGRGSTFKELGSEDLESLDLSVPPLDEQRAIAAFLDRETAKIDALVAKKEQLIELLQEKRTALITRAVTRGLDSFIDTRATTSRVFPAIPKDWVLWKLLRLIRQVKRPIVVEPETEYQEIGIRSWGRGIFHKDPIRGALLGDKSVFLPEPGDFVLNIVFAWEGAVAVASENERGMIASHRFPTFRPSADVDLDYFLMVLQSDQGRSLMEVNSPGAAGRNRTLRIGQFLDEEVPLPPLDAQRAIVAAFRREEQRISALEGKVRDAIAYFKELRTVLISAAVTGKIDVRSASDEATPGQGETR